MRNLDFWAIAALLYLLVIGVLWILGLYHPVSNIIGLFAGIYLVSWALDYVSRSFLD
jgi:hypothetical protein